MTPMGLGIGLGLADGGKGNTSGLGAGQGTIVVDDAGQWITLPKAKDDPLGLKLTGKNGGLAKFIFDIGSAEVNAIYTMRYSCDWSLLSNQGKEAFFGFGWKEADNDWHMVGNKGNGLASSFGIDIKRIWGTANFNGVSGFSEATDIPDNGTQEGPNWLQLQISSDGSTYTLRSSSDGVTWDDEIVAAAPTPTAGTTAPVTFGIAVFLENSDKGEFECTVELWMQELFVFLSPVAFANFTTPAATGNFSISTADLNGQTPIGAYIWLCNGEVTDVEYSAGTIGYHLHGATDGTTSWSFMDYVESGTNTELRGWKSSQILYIPAYVDATFVSFEADGMTINFATLAADVQDKLGFVMFITGNNSDCKVGVFNDVAVGPTGTTIDMGFTADAILGVNALTNDNAYTGSINVLVGWASNEVGAPQYSTQYVRSTGNGAGYAYNDGILSSGMVASFSGTEIKLAGAGTYDVPYFAFSFGGDLSVEAGFFDSPTSATTVTESGLGITPEKILILGGPHTTSWGVGVTHNGWSTSWFDAVGGVGSVSHSASDSKSSTTRLWNYAGNEQATLDSVASGEFTMDFSNASAVAVHYPYLVFGV